MGAAGRYSPTLDHTIALIVAFSSQRVNPLAGEAERGIVACYRWINLGVAHEIHRFVVGFDVGFIIHWLLHAWRMWLRLPTD